MEYRIRCVTSEEYTNMDNQILSKLNISLMNDYHKDFMDRLDKLLDYYNPVVIEYPREMCKEAGWIAGRVKGGRLRGVEFEMLHRYYVPRVVNEILVIGEGYDAKR